MRSGVAHGRRFFRSTLQPIAENLEYNPASIAARYRSNYLGSISLPSVQQASYSAAPGKPTRETGKTSPHDDAPANENTVPPVGSQDKQSGGKASKGHDAPTREELESQGTSEETTGGTSPTGKTDSHRSREEGTSHNAKPGEFAPSDPKKPEHNTPENAREKSGQVSLRPRPGTAEQGAQDKS